MRQRNTPDSRRLRCRVGTGGSRRPMTMRSGNGCERVMRPVLLEQEQVVPDLLDPPFASAFASASASERHLTGPTFHSGHRAAGTVVHPPTATPPTPARPSTPSPVHAIAWAADRCPPRRRWSGDRAPRSPPTPLAAPSGRRPRPPAGPSPWPRRCSRPLSSLMAVPLSAVGRIRSGPDAGTRASRRSFDAGHAPCRLRLRSSDWLVWSPDAESDSWGRNPAQGGARVELMRIAAMRKTGSPG